MAQPAATAHHNVATAPGLPPAGPVELPAESDTLYPVWLLLESVCDPEIPVVSLREMGILRALRPVGRTLEVVITPTYSGCPAMAQMADDILQTLSDAGQPATVSTVLAPPWSTTWMTASAHRKLREYGIAPPRHTASVCASRADTRTIRLVRTAASDLTIECPHCQSSDTVAISQFGSTACKALYRCLSCREPFDYFKPY